ncbi:MAG: hypothetical protein IAF38_06880 [Bacteroidia bacterium]|nr:hypothetical protein [Bacteroidia bacterium]
MNKLKFILFLFCTSFFAQKKTALQELEKVHAAFGRKATWAIIDIDGYKKESDAKSFKISNGEFMIVPGKGYYSSFEGELCISDRSRTLIIDKGNKTIGVVEQGMKDAEKKAALNTFDIKRSSESADTVYIEKDEKKGIGKVIIKTKDPVTPVVEIWYNCNDFAMTRIIYHYGKQGEEDYGVEKMVVTYTYKDAALINNDFFETGKVVKSKLAGGYAAQGEYKAYQTGKIN